jgi:hypothetical protein
MRKIDGRTVCIHRHDPLPDSGRVPTEVRFNRTAIRKGEWVHLRKWYLPPEGGEEFRPSKYGAAIPIDKVPDLLAGIEIVCPEAIEKWLAGDFEGFEVVRDQRAWLSADERRALTLAEKEETEEQERQERELQKVAEQLHESLGKCHTEPFEKEK